MRSTAETPSLEDVVKGFDHISVDDYQRTYEWDKDAITELFEDILAVSASNEPHFFGTLIFEDKGNGHGSLVDGQQKTSALQADAAEGLTPGFAFAMGVEMFQQGEDTAKELAAQILRDIETQYRKQVAGK